jgi:hypothetical protein
MAVVCLSLLDLEILQRWVSCSLAKVLSIIAWAESF